VITKIEKLVEQQSPRVPIWLIFVSLAGAAKVIKEPNRAAAKQDEIDQQQVRIQKAHRMDLLKKKNSNKKVYLAFNLWADTELK
jgi:hypothetical protein